MSSLDSAVIFTHSAASERAGLICTHTRGRCLSLGVCVCVSPPCERVSPLPAASANANGRC